MPFSFCLQSFSASQSFPVSQLFTSGGWSIGFSASTSVLPMSIQDWFPLGLSGLILLEVQGTLKSLLRHHILKASSPQHSAFFRVELLRLYVTTLLIHLTSILEHQVFAAAAKSLQPCPTLCDPIDSSPPAISFSEVFASQQWIS